MSGVLHACSIRLLHISSFPKAMQSCELWRIDVNSNSEDLEKNGILSSKTNACNSVVSTIGKFLSICMKLLVG